MHDPEHSLWLKIRGKNNKSITKICIYVSRAYTMSRTYSVIVSRDF